MTLSRSKRVLATPAPRAPPRTGAPPRAAGRVLRVALGLSLAWAAAATWLLLDDRGTIRRLRAEGEAQRLASEDKVRGLTRRLVGVASHEALQQEGLADQLADIIARQVDLEGRGAALSALANRFAAGTTAGGPDAPAAPGAPPSAGSAGAGGAPTTGPTRPPPRPGTPGSPGGSSGGPAGAAPGAVPGRGSALERDPASGSRFASELASRATSTPGGDPDPRAALARLPLREQFARLQASLARVEDAQRRSLAQFTAGALALVERLRAALADLGVKGAPADPAPGRDPPSAAGARDDEARAALAEAALGRLDRWRAATEAVPLRAPMPEIEFTSNFGTRKDPFTGAATMHAGVDFRSPVGTPVRATAAGRVITAGPTGGYGNLVEVDHGHDVVTRYGHLSAIHVRVDQAVTPATVLGLVGSTGRSTGPHLHYETRLSGGAVDPARFLAAGARLYGHPVASAAGADAASDD